MGILINRAGVKPKFLLARRSSSPMVAFRDWETLTQPDVGCLNNLDEKSRAGHRSMQSAIGRSSRGVDCHQVVDRKLSVGRKLRRRSNIGS